jgi:AcrR family transcriptional regulator
MRATPDAMKKKTAAADEPADVAQRILDVASDLFYRHGVRAVGVDLIVERSGVAKTSLYRHFRTKDDLVAAYLQREDKDFWGQWDRISDQHKSDPEAELKAHMKWIAERVTRPNYRGCPQINTAVEFPDPDHVARAVAVAHKREMRRRLAELAKRMGLRRSDRLAAQLALVIDGAFVSGQSLAKDQASALLLEAAQALIERHRTG